MKTKILEIYADNSASRWGVWQDNGKPAFGRMPLAVFDTLQEAQAFAVGCATKRD